MSYRDFTAADLHLVVQAVQHALDTTDLNDYLEEHGAKMPGAFDTTSVAPEVETVKERGSLGIISIEGWDDNIDEGVEIQLVVRAIGRGGATLTINNIDGMRGI